jgi:plastocyanin
VYPEGKVTGYYGALTQAAVGRWQAKNGIVSSGSPSTTGFGNVGPKTAAAMAAACGGSDSGDPVVGGFIKVSPILGDAPLTVNAEATINTTKSCLPATYTITWGDNSAPISISIPQGKCDVLSQTYSHTYTSGGSFTVTLASGEHATTATVGVNGSATMNMGGSTNTGNNTGTGSSNTSAGGTVSGSLSIRMKGSVFTPNNTTITSGTKVTWTNDDVTNHTVSADNGSYNSGPITPGKTYTLTFTTPGEYTYYCSYHGGPKSGMYGTIIVQ